MGIRGDGRREAKVDPQIRGDHRCGKKQTLTDALNKARIVCGRPEWSPAFRLMPFGNYSSAASRTDMVRGSVELF